MIFFIFFHDFYNKYFFILRVSVSNNLYSFINILKQTWIVLLSIISDAPLLACISVHVLLQTCTGLLSIIDHAPLLACISVHALFISHGAQLYAFQFSIINTRFVHLAIFNPYLFDMMQLATRQDHVHTMACICGTHEARSLLSWTCYSRSYFMYDSGSIKTTLPKYE